MSGTSVTVGHREHRDDSVTENLRLSNNQMVPDLEKLRRTLELQFRDQVVYSNANSGAGANLSVDASAQDVETDNAIDIQYNGLKFPFAAVAAIDISVLIPQPSTISTSKAGALWVFFNVDGTTVAVQTDIATAVWTSAIQSLAQYSVAGLTLPPAVNLVPIGVVQVTEGGSGAFTWGTDSITAETETYYSFNGAPGVVASAASFAATTGAAATIVYGAGKLRLGTGVLVSYTGKTGVTIAGSTVAINKVGAWIVYVLADDVEIAVQVAATYTSLEAARSAVKSLARNPLMPRIGAFYVQNNSTADFVPGTTNFNVSGITSTFDISTPDVPDIDQFSDLGAYTINVVE